MNLYFRLSDYRLLSSAVSPVVAYVVPWLLVLLGQIAALCYIIVPEYSSFYLIILGNMVTSVGVAIFIQTLFPQKLLFQRDHLHTIEISDRLKRTLFYLLSFYVIAQTLQVLYFKGFPLLWLFLKNGKTYMDYGFKSFNGLINGIYLLVTTAYFLIYLKERKKRQLFLVLGLLSFPILFVNRQIMFSIFLQVACCCLLFYPKMIKKFALAALAILVIFVIMGNMRTGIDHLIKILKPHEDYPEGWYSLLWLYAYMVTPFNNINASIDYIQPLGHFYFQLAPLLPSVIRTRFLPDDVADTGYVHVHDNLNVASFYFFPLLDFGKLYAFLFMFLFQIFLFIAFRRALRAKTITPILEYSVLYMVMVLSIFSNLLLYLPIMVQLVILQIAKWRLFRREGVLAVSPDRFTN